MAESISFDYSNAMFMVDDADIATMKEKVLEAKKTLLDRTGEGNDFLGWIDLPVNYDRDEFNRIKKMIYGGYVKEAASVEKAPQRREH
mgnify:CR=1 FL=1